MMKEEDIQKEKVVVDRDELEDRIGERIAGTLISTLSLSPQASWTKDGVKTNLREHKEKNDKYVFWQESSDGHPWEED